MTTPATLTIEELPALAESEPEARWTWSESPAQPSPMPKEQDHAEPDRD